MHLPDGFIAGNINIATAGVTILVAGVALKESRRTLEDKHIPLMGVTAAFIFAAQMLNFPVGGGTSGHFLGAFLGALLLGPLNSFLIMSMVLTLQAFMFGDGGISSLGTNIFNMGVVGGILPWIMIFLLKSLLPKSKKVFIALVAFGAWFSVVAASLICAIQISMSGIAPISITLPAMGGVHMIIGIGEALITVGAIQILLKQRPDMINFWSNHYKIKGVK
jgi:cobalt/nickel transport system permease protein